VAIATRILAVVGGKTDQVAFFKDRNLQGIFMEAV
jgi:hypothetical protein